MKRQIENFIAFVIILAVAAWFTMRGLAAVHANVLPAVEPAGYWDSFDVTVWAAGAAFIARAAWNLR